MAHLDAHLLACPPKIRQALLDSGYNTVHDVVHVHAIELAKEIRTSPEEAQYVIDLAKSKALGSCVTSSISFKTALELFEHPDPRIATGIERLDETLGGGITMGQLTEICGPPGAGKTQLSMLLSVMAAHQDEQNDVLYIDTEGSFVPERIEEISQKLFPKAAVNHVLSKIQYVRIHSPIEQMAFITAMPEYLDQHPNVKLIVIDSIAFHMRQEMKDASTKQHVLANMFQLLTKLACNKKCAVCITNHVTVRRIDDKSSKLVPALGDLWSHFPAERFLVYNSDGFRGLLLHKSPSSPQILIDLNNEMKAVFSN